MEALAALMASALPVKPAIESVPSDGDADFHLALVALAERHDLADALFVDVRSAREAMAYVRANHHRDCSPAALAAIAGVTERTLRERFRQCLGVSIAAFVQRQVPGVQRVEFCHDLQKIVVRQGWTPLGAGCQPAAGDRVIPLPAAPAAGNGA